MNRLVATLAAALLVGVLAPSASAADPVLELRESFADVPNGPAPATLVGTGVPVTNFQGSLAATPYVRDGFLTFADPVAAVGGAYRIARLDAPVTRVGGTFAFTPYTAGGGVFCLSIQTESIATTTPVPVSPVHLVVTPKDWSVDVNTEAGTGVDPIAGGTFATPLATDGSTLHTVEFAIDSVTRQLELTLPDGSRHVIGHEAFGLVGQYVYVEPFKSASPRITEETVALVREWWASAGRVDIAAPPAAVVSEVAPPAPVVAEPLPREPVPAVTVPQVERVAAPGAPSRVRAQKVGPRALVTWRAARDAARHVVQCGDRARVVVGRKVALRSSSAKCRVRAMNVGGASPWVRVRVRA